MRRSLRFVSLATRASFATLVACAPNPAPVAPAPLSAPDAHVAAQLASPVATTTSAAIEQAPPPRDDGRLPASAVPRRYALTLAIDPGQERFQGEVAITLDVPQPTSHVVLHGRSLNVLQVTATTGSGALTGSASARASHGATEADEIVLSFPAPLPAGRAVLSVTYDAPFDRALSGVYRVKEGERWYAFTQFESTYARRGFPCFDEPGYKVPFDLQITVPKGMIAVANTPEIARADAAPTRTRFDFTTTPPLPTYLLAFAVGDFDVRAGAKTPVPIRIVTVKGTAHLGESALDATAGLVKKLGDYFAIPYPFAKLDVVAVPEFAAGAMENPGLITFREEDLLLDPANPGVEAKRRVAVTIAHELAHMWFGDLVTMKWWNDVWLNEGFATWMETKATDAWHPDYTERYAAALEAQQVMDTDALASARAVRQSVTTSGEIEEAFDEISYQKGAALLAMVERWIGPDAMQRGVRDYLHASSWKNAEAADLLGALDHASGKDVSGLAATFLDRPGVPNVTFTSSCAGGKLTLGLTQSAWHPLGVDAKETDRSPWKIPVCARALASGAMSKGGAGKDQCVELGAGPSSIVLDVAACPAGAVPNAGAAGYYRTSSSEADLRVLARNQAQLDVPERIAFVSNLWAQVSAGQLAPEVALAILPAFDKETDSRVLQTIVDTLYAFDHDFIDGRARTGFRGYVATRLARAKMRLGWDARVGESGDVALARRVVLRGMGELAHDPSTILEAKEVASRWLKDKASVDPDIASVALPLASMGAGPARLEELRLALRSAKAPTERLTALTAMGAFDDKTMLESAWDLALTDQVREQDFYRLFTRMFRRADTAREYFSWLQTHWDGARAKTPVSYASELTRVVGTACTKDELDAELAFLGPRLAELEGAARPLAEETEVAKACIALRTQGADGVLQFFKDAAK